MPTPAFAQTDDFNAAYEATYGHPASDAFGTAAMYDSVYVVALAAVAANSNDRAAIHDHISLVANAPGDITTYGSDAFSAAVTALSESSDVNYVGASGQVDIDANGELAKSSVQTWRVINGTIAPIETRDIDLAAEAGIQLPAPSPASPPTATPETELHIGVIVPDDDSGTALSDAAKLAISEINGAGGVWGKDVVLHVQTIGSADQASHAAGLLATDDSVSAIIGPTTLDAVSSALPTAAEANVPLLALTTDAGLSKLADEKNMLYQMVPSDALQMPVLANLYLEGFLPAPGTDSPAPTAAPAGSVCIVFQAGDASKQMSETFAKAMTFKKAAVRANVPFDPATVDYAALLKDCIGS
ncbi:MAG: ABC transporter substrate-binding protein [Chloroflexota bacterium]